jgi:hypothetical protein
MSGSLSKMQFGSAPFLVKPQSVWLFFLVT